MGDLIARGIAGNGLRNSLLSTNANNNYRKYTPLFRETFGDLTRWVAEGYGTVEDDTVNYSMAGIDKREDGTWVATAGHAMKFTKTIDNFISAKAVNTFAAVHDFTGQHGVLRYYIHEGTGDSSYEYLDAVYVMLIDSADVVSYWVDFGVTSIAPLPAFKPGWRTFPMTNDNFAVKGAGFDITHVKKIQIMFSTHTGEEAKLPVITFDFLEFFPKITTPIPYVITMDGGYTAQKEALAYLTARGIKAHVYCSYDSIGTSGYMTLDDLKQAQFMGHTIDIHERGTAPTGWWTLTQAQKEASLESGINWKLKNGFSGKGFATLGTQWFNDDDTLNTLNTYLEHIRITGTTPWNPRILGINYETNNLTVEAEATARALAISRGTFYIGLIHGLTGAFTLANFKTIIEAGIADTDVTFVTVAELLNTNWYAAH